MIPKKVKVKREKQKLQKNQPELKLAQEKKPMRIGPKNINEVSTVTTQKVSVKKHTVKEGKRT